MKEVRATLSNARISPQKVRLVVDQVRGLSVAHAKKVLDFSPKKAAGIVKKLLMSAIANAKHNEGLDVEIAWLCTAFVDEAPRLKRVMPRAKGRANRIVKRSSHITLVVAA